MYLSLNNDISPNHSYVVISDIGSAGDDTALICHTNRPAKVSGGVVFFFILEDTGLDPMGYLLVV